MNDQSRREMAAVAPTAGKPVSAFVPSTIEEIKWVCGMIIDAGLAPASYNTNGKADSKKVAIGVMSGLEAGIMPFTAMKTIAIINNQPCLYGDGPPAQVQRSGFLVNQEEKEIGAIPSETDQINQWSDDYGFEVRCWRKGQDRPYVGRYTVGDARRAKLWLNPRKRPWMENPKRMLKIRARTFALRDGFADCLMGLSIAEEVEDIPAAPEQTDTGFLDGGIDITPKPKQIESEATEDGNAADEGSAAPPAPSPQEPAKAETAGSPEHDEGASPAPGAPQPSAVPDPSEPVKDAAAGSLELTVPLRKDGEPDWQGLWNALDDVIKGADEAMLAEIEAHPAVINCADGSPTAAGFIKDAIAKRRVQLT